MFRGKTRGRRRSASFSFCAISAGLAIAIFLAGCSTRTPPAPVLTPQQQRGQRIFKATCAACHGAGAVSPAHGPPLQGLFKKKYLPSGAPANDDRVRQTIRLGRHDMPAFGNLLNDSQIDDLIAYLHSL